MKVWKKSFNLLVKRLIKVFMFLAPQLEKVIGLSRLGDGFLLKALSAAYKIFLVTLFPLSLVRVLVFLELKDSTVTQYARNTSFLVNWFLIVLVYWNETFSHGNDLLDQLGSLTNELMRVQSARKNFIMLLRFTVKAALLGSLTLKTNYGKYFFHVKPNMTLFDKFLGPMLLLPFAVVAATANRIFVANTVIRNSLAQISKGLKSSSSSIEVSAEKYSRLHNFFVRFHIANVKNLIAIIASCAMNTTYQVMV